jgi:hypothetical protein
MFSFKCACCGEVHEGMPSFDADAPATFYGVPEDERESRCQLTSDECVIDGHMFFVRGCVEIPVLDEADSFSWGVWVSLSEASFLEWRKFYDVGKRTHVGPFFGWLNTSLECYPDSLNLKTMVHLRDAGIRPFVELEPTDHSLAVEQRTGITATRAAELLSYMLHSNQL